MLKYMSDAELLTALYGAAIVAAMGVILSVLSRVTHIRWLRPGTWIAVFFWKLAQYSVAFARGVDAFVVEYRKTKQEWADSEILNSEH